MTVDVEMLKYTHSRVMVSVNVTGSTTLVLLSVEAAKYGVHAHMSNALAHYSDLSSGRMASGFS